MYDAIDAAKANALPYIEHGIQSHTEALGRFYHRNDKKVRPLNLMDRSATTMIAHLAHRNPGHEVRASSQMLRGDAKVREILLDHVSDEMERLRLTRMQLMRAFFFPMAVMKIGIRAGDDMVKINDRFYSPGQPYILPIDFTDHLADSRARCRSEMAWEGNRYRIPRFEAAECGLFDPDVIMSLPAVGDVDRADQPSSEFIGKSQGESFSDMLEEIELIDVCFYHDNGSEIATLSAERTNDYLRIGSFEGSDRGPYEWLEFHPQPNQLYGQSIASKLREQHDTMVRVSSKSVDQIERSMRILAGNRGQKDDLKTVGESFDGALVEVDDINGLKNFDVGGLMPDLGPFMQMVQSWGNSQYVNFEVAAGQEGGTDKATIYQGIQAAMNVMIGDLQNTHEEYESRISRQLLWYLDNDPLIQKNMTMRLPGGEYIDVIYDAQTKKGDFEDFSVKVRYGSMIRQDPQVKAQSLLKLVELAMQSVQVTMATGGVWNSQAALRIMARELNFDEMDELIQDPMLIQAMMQRMQVVPQPGQGQVAGQSQVNPEAAYGGRPQMGAENPRAGMRTAQPQSNAMTGVR